MEQGEIILYQPDEAVKLEVRLEDETVWLTQEQIADLFGTKRPAITKHLNNIYKSGELDIDSTCSILEHMGNDGKQRYTTKYYNLDAILSIGYRVNSKNATLFRNIIKDTFLSSTKVIELDNFSYGRFIVVSQDTTVCVFSFPKILHTIHPFLSLNHKSVCFTLPLLNKDRVQFKLNAIDFLSLPASESKYVIVERTAAVSADIEGLAVFLYFLHDFLGT